MAGGGGWETSWETSERKVQTLEVVGIWGDLPPARTEAAVARGDCFTWKQSIVQRASFVLYPAAHTPVALHPNGA